MNCPDGKCNVASRIAAARAGRAHGIGATSDPALQERVRQIMWQPSLPSATGSGIGIGVIALVVLAVIVLGKK